MRSVVFGVVATFILGAHTLAIADWQLVTSNVVSGTVLPFTNLVVRKLSAEVCREDNFPSFSRIIFASRREQVTLNHSDKTYVRQPLPDESTQLQPPPVLSSLGETALIAGTSAEGYRWTNATARGCSWVASATPFLSGITNRTGTNALQNEVTANLMVGSFLDRNRIVVCTEYTAAVPASALASSSSINITFTLASTLVSITETNFSPSEFVIPPDYTDVTGQPPKPFQMNPGVFGSRTAGQNNLEGLRSGFQEGKAVLQVPHIKPAQTQQ